MPSRYDKEKRWRGLPLRDVVAKAPGIAKQAASGGKDAKNKAVAPVKFLKLPTVDKHFSNLVEYWVWLQKTGLIGKDQANPFTGFIQSKPQGKRARKERNAWPQDMLTKLLTSPVWTGCFSLARRSKPGTHIYRDTRFWVPLIGRGLGCREDEICSLEVGDIRFEDGIPMFHISNSKTEGSERDIPIPEWLLIMGFLEHRFYGRHKSEPLFPELLPQGVEGRRSSSFSSWFTEYRRAVECYQLLVDSLRPRSSHARTAVGVCRHQQTSDWAAAHVPDAGRPQGRDAKSAPHPGQAAGRRCGKVDQTGADAHRYRHR